MFYLNVRYRFALPLEAGPIAGGIIAASAMPAGQLLRRDFRKYPYLQHRLFDPQLYLAGLDPNVARESVVKLASFPWFGSHGVPEYDSEKHGTLVKWKGKYGDKLIAAWPRKPVTKAGDIAAAAREAVRYQLSLECNAIILPLPLTTVATQHFAAETEWIDAGISACKELRVTLPIYATVALSDTALRGISEPEKNPLLASITDQIASRDQLAGAYVVLEQTGQDSYVCTIRESLLSLLLVTDDLVRGASRQVIVNYAGTFGAVLAAAGASIWASGYYRSQRRLKLADFEDDVGLARPRFFAPLLAGDVGVESELQMLFDRDRGLGDRLVPSTAGAKVVRDALEAGTFPLSSPEWAYEPNNVTAAAAHYTEVVSRLGARLRSLEPPKRVELVHRWLRGAVGLVDRIRAAGLARSTHTDLVHQRVWLDAYEEWKARAGA